MGFRGGKWVEPTREDVHEWVNDLMAESVPRVVQEESPQSRREEALKLYEVVSREGELLSIIVPVYNSLHLVKQVIESVKRHTTVPYELIVVNDGSTDKEVDTYLKNCGVDFYHTHPHNMGFAAACNTGFRIAAGRYVCILNVDVLLTPHWAEKMIAALQPEDVAMVNPVTNNTAMLSVPMRPGMSYFDMNRLLEHNSTRRYPEIMPTGFCLMFKRKLLGEIGPFDEAFISYGEESDWWMRALFSISEKGDLNRYKAVLADDCYVFHQRSGSFSQLGKAKHEGYRIHGSKRFHVKHPEFQDWMQLHNMEEVMAPLRAPMPVFPHNYKYRVCYVVRSADFCGGMKFIADIVNEWIERGVDAKVAVIKREKSQGHTWLDELHTAPIFFDSEEEFLATFDRRVFDNGVIIAGVGEVLPIVKKTAERYMLIPLFHAQSYDPDLAQNEEDAEKLGQVYEDLPYTIAVSETLADKLTLFSTVIEPGVDKNIFHRRRDRNNDERTHVLFILNKNYWFKGYDFATSIMKELAKDPGIKLYAAGVDFVVEIPEVTALGFLTSEQMAETLQDMDLVFDPSHVHSYGLPEREANACGVKAINRAFYPASNYIDIIKGTLDKSILNPFHFDSPDRKDQVDEFIAEVEASIGYSEVMSKDILVVTPHMRKFGGPTTIINLANILSYLGHNVKLLTIYEDFKIPILEYVDKKIPVYVGLNKVPSCDTMIINSDNPFIGKLKNLNPEAEHVMLKLSHNERFKEVEEASLRGEWDKILCSTKPLVDKVITPTEGWDYPSRDGKNVHRIGWYHYEHDRFACAPSQREYAPRGKLRIGTLVHAHQLKGTKVALAAMYGLRKKYGDDVVFFGVGEMLNFNSKPSWFEYYQRPTRDALAEILKHCDIWIGASYTEGLGRMALEAMSAGAVVVASDTGAEFLEDNVNCLLFPTGNPQTAAEKVDILIKDRELLDKLAQMGYDTACKYAEPFKYISNLKQVFSAHGAGEGESDGS